MTVASRKAKRQRTHRNTWHKRRKNIDANKVDQGSHTDRKMTTREKAL